MKKMKYIIALIVLALLFTGCSKEDEEKKGSFAELKEEVNEEFQLAKDGKYENLNILCDEVILPESDELKVMRFPVYTFTKEMTLKEKLEFYRDVVFPKVLDVDTVDEKYIVDTTSYDFDTQKFSRDYAYMMEHLDELEDSVHIGYDVKEEYKSVETIPEGVCFNIALGKIGGIVQKKSAFVASNFEEIKTYNCYLDDLSDSYLLMDGEKTVAEAKMEIEKYLNEHYPLIGENGIQNEVCEITVRKIPNTEFHIFDARRTLSYEGISVKTQINAEISNEVIVMGQAYLCESNKVDILLGFVNCFDSGSIDEVYEEFVSFEEIMERLSYYMTDGTIFNIKYAGLEYRMFTEVVEEVGYYIWTPYWTFLVENPNDNSIIRVYINMKTGEIDSYQS